jgi:hypothetical protein
MTSTARIRFTCLHCDKRISVKPAAAGRTLPCPNPECGKRITVPLPGVNDATTPSDSALPASGATSAAPSPASTQGAKWTIASALGVLSLGLVLSFFLMKPSKKPPRLVVQGIAKKTLTPVKPLVTGDQDNKATVSAAPKPKARTSPSQSPEPQRKLASEQPPESKAAPKEQAARKERNRLLSEYAAVARIQSFEYYHNDKRMVPRWDRPPTEVTMARNLNLPKYDDDLPRVAKLLGSDNENIREISASIVKSHTVIEMYRHDVAFDKDNVTAQTIKALTSFESYNAGAHRRALMGGVSAKSEQEVQRANFKQAVAVLDSQRQHEKANQAYLDPLRKLVQERERIIYRLAKELAGPPPDKPVGIQLNVEAFVPGEPVFRASPDSSPTASTMYCLTLANGDEKLTHCSIAVILRRLPDRRTAEGGPARFGPPLSLDEFTDAVMRRDPSRRYADDVVLYYIGAFNSHERVHFFQLQWQYVMQNVESIGVVLFADQMTLVGDPNPCFQELGDSHLGLTGQNVGYQGIPQNRNGSSNSTPAGRLSAGTPSSRRTTARGAPRRQ